MHLFTAGSNLQRAEEAGRQEQEAAGEGTPYQGGVFAR